MSGPVTVPVIQPSIGAMKRITPDSVVPMHCTGWTAINRFFEELPCRIHFEYRGDNVVF